MKHSKKVYVYSLQNELIGEYNSAVKLGEWLKIDKSTVGKYIKSGKIWKDKYRQ